MANNKKHIRREQVNKAVAWNKFWIVLTIILAVIYLVWRIFITYPHDKGNVSWIFWGILLVVEIYGLFEMAVHFYNMYDFEKAQVKKGALPESLFPHVDVLIPSLNEPAELLSDTLQACLLMDYPDKSKVHIYLCDDGERKEIAELCEKLGVNYFGRTTHENAKAGNLNHALSQSDSPYVAIFDADMKPAKDFLMETVPLFDVNVRKDEHGKKNKKASKNAKNSKNMVGFVQTPQHFYEPDLFQINLYQENDIPNEQDYFYKVVELSKNKSNSVIFGGSNAVLSRKALEDIGGIVTGVLTEDFATGIEIEKMGYKGVAIDKVLASGKTPDTFAGLIKQRKRWAKGCIQSGKETHFLRAKGLTLIQKINYLTSITYWYTPVKRLVYFLAPVLFALFGIVIVECTLPQALIFWMPLYICSNIAVRRFSQGIRITKWTDIYDNTMFPYLLFSVIKETFVKSKDKFAVTKKESTNEKTSKAYYMLPFVLGAGISVYSIVKLIALSASEQTPTYLVVLFWLFINLYYMVVSMLAVWGRRYEKKADFESPKGLKKGFGIDVSLKAFAFHFIRK